MGASRFYSQRLQEVPMVFVEQKNEERKDVVLIRNPSFKPQVCVLVYFGI